VQAGKAYVEKEFVKFFADVDFRPDFRALQPHSTAPNAYKSRSGEKNFWLSRLILIKNLAAHGVQSADKPQSPS
jgi:hypothetical protein